MTTQEWVWLTSDCKRCAYYKQNGQFVQAPDERPGRYIVGSCEVWGKLNVCTDGADQRPCAQRSECLCKTCEHYIKDGALPCEVLEGWFSPDTVRSCGKFKSKWPEIELPGRRSHKASPDGQVMIRDGWDWVTEDCKRCSHYKQNSHFAQVSAPASGIYLVGRCSVRGELYCKEVDTPKACVQRSNSLCGACEHYMKPGICPRTTAKDWFSPGTVADCDKFESKWPKIEIPQRPEGPLHETNKESYWPHNRNLYFIVNPDGTMTIHEYHPDADASEPVMTFDCKTSPCGNYAVRDGKVCLVRRDKQANEIQDQGA